MADGLFGKIGNLDFDGILKGVNFDKFHERVQKEQEKMEKLNMLVVGKTGVGKSTLINAVFGADLAKTGIGRPVTEHCEAYTIPESPITIYDSRGLELNKDNGENLKEIYDVVKSRNSSGNTQKYIHICWYCMSENIPRLEDAEINIIRDIRRLIPVIIVLTQSPDGDDTQKFINEIKSAFAGDDIDVVPIMAKPKNVVGKRGQINIESYGLDELVEKSYEYLAESVKKTFAAFQQSSIKLKKYYAFNACVLYSGAVAASAFQPFPIADAVIMTSIQVTMMASITACFGLNPLKLNLKTVILGLGGPFAAIAVGRTLVSLLKLIPGFGTAAGGMINATTGGSITLALGRIYIGVLSSIVEDGCVVNEFEILTRMAKAVKNLDWESMKNEWAKYKDSYSKSEADGILAEAKEDAGHPKS